MQFGHALRCVLYSALPLELRTACSVTAILLCCSYAVRCVHAAGRWACSAVCCCTTGMLLCSGVLCGVLCCALCCMAVLCRAVLCVRVCCLPVCVAALCELLVRCAWREALLYAALPCCAVFCSAVRWNGREMKEK